MADYRQFCESCGQEVGFGHHAPDCPAPARAREFIRQREEQRAKEKAEREAPYVDLSDVDLIQAAMEAENAEADAYEVYYPLKQKSQTVKEMVLRRGLANEYLAARRELNGTARRG